MNNNYNAKERRQYYRIDDSAIFSYQILNDSNSLSEDELKEKERFSAAFEMIEWFNQMNPQMSSTLARISEDSTDIAAYLKDLDNKIGLLAQICLFQEKGSNLEPHRQINLGAGGLAFNTDEKFQQGTLIEMDMILSTDFLCLHLQGRIIQIADNQDGDFPYRVSVGFTEITELEIDQIIKHILRLQAEHLRTKKEL